MIEKVIVLHPVLPESKKGKREESSVHGRDAAASLEEAVGLAAAIHLNVVHAEVVKLSRIVPGTFLTTGVLARTGDYAKEKGAHLVVINHALTPTQQRNLEKELDCKVIDRTGLILEIFGARARTKEGTLQVDLAALTYQRSRIVKAWTHLERQRGGYGFTGGPGETQKEMDRRMLDEKIRRLKVDLEDVKRTRRLQRKSRQKEPYPVVALVGYTNAGKSTLFNRLTGAEVFAKDLLFATLDTTMRVVKLPSGRQVILSDTVGFISDLPTHLVAAFRATLEEVQEASVILHVRDIAQEYTEAEKEDVFQVLEDLGIDPARDERMIEVWNKIDVLPNKERAAALTRASRRKSIVALSALTGEGVDDVLEEIDICLSRHRKTVYVDVALSDGAALAWLYRRGHVVERVDDEDFARLKLRLDPADCARFASQYDYKLESRRPRQKKKA